MFDLNNVWLTRRHCRPPQQSLSYSRLLPARRYAIAVLVYARYLYLSLSQIRVLSKRTDESSWFLTRRLPLSYPTLCHEEIRVSPKINGTSVCDFRPNFGLRKLSHGALVVATCCQLSSTQVDAQCDKLATIVG